MKKFLIACACLIVLPQVVMAAQFLTGQPLVSVTGSASKAATATVLNVPYYSQVYTNSCEAASLRMVLAYHGIKATDMEIIKQFGYDPHLKDVSRNVWDDPQKQFVGYVNATGRGQGYGVHGLPVVQAVLDYDLNADYYSGTSSITTTLLAESIRAGNPVVLWGYTSLTEKPYTWTTPEGKTVTAFRGEHARTVVGVLGPSSAPIGFYVHDPFNKQKYQFWPAASLMNQVRSVPGVTDQAVVVRR